MCAFASKPNTQLTQPKRCRPRRKLAFETMEQQHAKDLTLEKTVLD